MTRQEGTTPVAASSTSVTTTFRTPQHDLFEVVRAIPSVEDFLYLRSAAGMSPRSNRGAAKGLGNELCCVILRSRQNNRIVGMGRIVGDGGTVYHICDMAVIPEYQKKGGGSMIMNELMKYIEQEAPEDSYVNLIADVSGFYERWGFKLTSPVSNGMYFRT